MGKGPRIALFMCLVIALALLAWGLAPMLATKDGLLGDSPIADLVGLLDGIGTDTDEMGSPDSTATTSVTAPEPDGFVYATLSADQKDAYAQILPHLEAREASFDVRCANADDLEVAYNAAKDDHPELFWLSSYSYVQLGDTITVKPDFPFTASEIDWYQEEIERVAADALATLPAEGSTYDRVRALYEWVVLNTTYGHTDHDQTILGAMVEGTAVCAGYARTFQYLCQLASIPCGYVTGYLDEGEPHAWCLVTIDGTPQYVDVTWGDPDAVDSGNGWEVYPEGITYDYLCLTGEAIERDRTTTSPASGLPVVDSMEYDTYVRAGTYFAGFDRADLDYAIAEAFAVGESSVAVKYETAEAYEEALYLLGTQDIFDGPLGEIGYFTSNYNDALYTIHVRW